MATTATRIVPDRKAKGQTRKPMSKAQKAKLAAALKAWRDSLSDEDKAELRARNAEKHRERWNSMSEAERTERLAGVQPSQLGQLYKATAGRSFEDRRDRALMTLLADSGMRRGEIAGLTVADLHLDGEGFILLRGETSKGRRDRLVPLSRAALAALDKYLECGTPTPTPRCRGCGSEAWSAV